MRRRRGEGCGWLLSQPRLCLCSFHKSLIAALPFTPPEHGKHSTHIYGKSRWGKKKEMRKKELNHESLLPVLLAGVLLKECAPRLSLISQCRACSLVPASPALYIWVVSYPVYILPGLRCWPLLLNTVSLFSFEWLQTGMMMKPKWFGSGEYDQLSHPLPFRTFKKTHSF